MTSRFREDLVAASVIGIDIGKEVFHLVGCLDTRIDAILMKSQRSDKARPPCRA
jgi:hypothetical protein